MYFVGKTCHNTIWTIIGCVGDLLERFYLLFTDRANLTTQELCVSSVYFELFDEVSLVTIKYNFGINVTQTL